MSARRFVLHRRVDGTTMALADGVEFDDGICFVHGRLDTRTTSGHMSTAEVQKYYRLKGCPTTLDWIDEEELS